MDHLSFVLCGDAMFILAPAAPFLPFRPVRHAIVTTLQQTWFRKKNPEQGGWDFGGYDNSRMIAVLNHTAGLWPDS